MYRFLHILLLTLFLSSCVSRPDYVLDEDKMVAVLCDVHRSEGLLELQQNHSYQSFKDEYKRNVMAAVLVKNGITRAQYDSSLVWYGQNLKDLVKVYSKVQKSLDDEIQYWTDYDLQNQSEFAMSDEGDTVQIWSISSYYTIDESRLSSTKFWEIKTDSNFYAGDSINWRLHVPVVPESHYVVASLSLNYEVPEDSEDLYLETTSCLEVLKLPASVNLGCRADSTRQFKSVIASISLFRDNLATPDGILFVDSLSMVRIHK